MGLFDFVKNAGAKLFGKDDADPNKIVEEIRRHGFEVHDLRVAVNDDVATVGGSVDSHADREKVVLVVGNTEGIARVDDRMRLSEKGEQVEAAVVAAEQEAEEKARSTFYTVKSGDTLGKIAKEHYGNAMKYPVIFEANKPMLKDPDKIYPGQVLRIPPIEG